MKKKLIVLALLGFSPFQAQAEMPIIEIMESPSGAPMEKFLNKDGLLVIKRSSVGQFYLFAKNRVEALKKDEDNICIHVSDKNFFQRFLKEEGGMPPGYLKYAVIPYSKSMFLASLRTSKTYDLYANDIAKNGLPHIEKDEDLYFHYVIPDFAFNCYHIEHEYGGPDDTFNMSIVSADHYDMPGNSIHRDEHHDMMPGNKPYSLYFSFFFYKDYKKKGLKQEQTYMFKLDG